MIHPVIVFFLNFLCLISSLLSSSSFALHPLNLSWEIPFTACMAVSNCNNLRNHIRQGVFKTHPYSVGHIVGDALGRYNQLHRSQEEELIIYWPHTTQHQPHSPSAMLSLLSPSISFSISSEKKARFNSLWCHTSEEERFIPFLLWWE